MVMRANISEDMAERKGYFAISALSASVVGQSLSMSLMRCTMGVGRGLRLSKLYSVILLRMYLSKSSWISSLA
jgi:hypothetical protein